MIIGGTWAYSPEKKNVLIIAISLCLQLMEFYFNPSCSFWCITQVISEDDITMGKKWYLCLKIDTESNQLLWESHTLLSKLSTFKLVKPILGQVKKYKRNSCYRRWSDFNLMRKEPRSTEKVYSVQNEKLLKERAGITLNGTVLFVSLVVFFSNITV